MVLIVFVGTECNAKIAADKGCVFENQETTVQTQASCE